MKKMILGGLAAAAMLAGGIAFTPAGVASAHHPEVIGTAECRDDGTYWNSSSGSDGECPPEPPAEVVRVHTCETPGVVYVTTTSYVWDPMTWSWVPDTPVETTEPATPEQIESCKPEPTVTVTEWQDGTIVCDATTVTQTRTVTTTPWVWDAYTSEFVPDEANATVVTETRTRVLSPGEIVPCPTVPSTSSTTSTTTTTTVLAVLPPTQIPTTTAAPVAPPTPSTPAAVLPATGNDSTAIMALIALLATSLGGAVLIIARRRNPVS